MDVGCALSCLCNEGAQLMFSALLGSGENITVLSHGFFVMDLSNRDTFVKLY